VAWLWVVGGLIAWLLAATVVAVGIGRAVRLADRHTPGVERTLTTADLPSSFLVPGQVEGAAGRHRPATRRRAVPLPPVGIGLAAIAVALMTAGYVLRLTDATGPLAQALDLDAAGSAPRMYVAALFAVAAVAAVAGAARATGRRTWWLAVALVSGLIATVKAGGTVHHDGMSALRDAAGEVGAIAVSGLAAGSVVVGLWILTRNERRDRRRVLGTLSLYAGASVGLSAVSTIVPSGWAATATYLEESGEALAAVAFLMGVLVGVAPRLVLPAAWALRRADDAHSLALAESPEHRAARGARG